MTTDNWLMIVVIISTLIAPTVAVFVQSRINQPTQIPVASQPPSRIHRIGGWFKRIFASPWLQVLLIFLNLYNLVSVMRLPRPLDQWGVLLIAIPIAAIALNLAAIMYMDLSRRLDNFLHFYREDAVKQTKFDLSLLEIMKDLADAAKTGDLGILDLIKNLSNDLRAAFEPKSELPTKREPKKRKRE
jgi:hypothetical protein